MTRTTMTITGRYEPCRFCWAPVVSGCALPPGWRLDVRRETDPAAMGGVRGYAITILTPHTADCRE